MAHFASTTDAIAALDAPLGDVDPEIAELVEAEARRQAETDPADPERELRLAGRARGDRRPLLTNKYSEGYPGKRYYEGQQVIDQVESLAIERAKALFGVEHANVQPYSGSPANLAVYLAFLEPGDTVMGMALPMGGHLTHGWSVSATGKWFRPVQYEVGRETRPHRPRRGARAGPRRAAEADLLRRHRDPPRRSTSRASRRSPARSTRFSCADIAHIAGLSPAGRTRRRSPHADVISTTTHKTLRGPRGAMLMSREEHAKAIDNAVFPGLQGGPHNHTTAAIAVALQGGAPADDFRDYAHADRRQREGAGRQRSPSAASSWSPAAPTTT